MIKLESLKDHSLINKTKFLKATDKRLRPIVKKILKNTKYVNHNEFIKNLYNSVKSLAYMLKKLKKKEIYVYKTKKFTSKSNGWIYNYMEKILKSLKINIKIKLIDNSYKKINDNDIIIFTDDCVYSGMQMRNNINNFLKYNKNKIKKYLYILAPYVSSSGIKVLTNKKDQKKYNYRLLFSKHKNIDKYNIYNVLDLNEIKLIESYYSNLKLKDIKRLKEDRYLTDFNGLYLIYFNHKLADMASTISLFYMGVVPNTYNRKVLMKRTKEKNKRNNLKLQIIPLINNCNYNKLKINVHNPICPKPPYK